MRSTRGCLPRRDLGIGDRRCLTRTWSGSRPWPASFWTSLPIRAEPTTSVPSAWRTRPGSVACSRGARSPRGGKPQGGAITMQTVVRLASILRPYRGYLALGFIAALGASAADLLQPWPLKIVFDNVFHTKPLPPALGHPIAAVFGAGPG